MQCVEIECPQNVLIMRCEKDDCRYAFNGQRTQNVEPVHARHLDVEEYNIGRSLQNSVYRVSPIPAFSNDINILEPAQHEGHATARQRLVIDDQSPHGEAS